MSASTPSSVLLGLYPGPELRIAKETTSRARANSQTVSLELDQFCARPEIAVWHEQDTAPVAWPHGPELLQDLCANKSLSAGRRASFLAVSDAHLTVPHKLEPHGAICTTTLLAGFVQSPTTGFAIVCAATSERTAIRVTAPQRPPQPIRRSPPERRSVVPDHRASLVPDDQRPD
jgi:hypothetical protein